MGSFAQETLPIPGAAVPSSPRDSSKPQAIPVMHPKSLLARATGFLAGLATITAASAAITVSSFTNVAPDGPASGDPHDPSTAGSPDLLSASSSDLAQGLMASVTYITNGSPSNDGSTTQEDSAGEVAWTDGSIGTVYGGGGLPNATAHAGYGTVYGMVGGFDVDSFVTFDLGGLYHLDQVDVFLGWNDSGRDDSSFNLLVSTDGVAFSQIAGYVKGPDNTGAITTPVTNLHRITDDGGAPIAESIRYVQLQFTDADNGYAGMAEVDIFGTVVPEPTAPVLLGIAGFIGLCRRRRCRNA